jgi:uncharacterized protein (DUF433 family)
MSNPNTRQWKYLDRKPGSLYTQLFIKGRGIRALTLYMATRDEECPRTLEEIAADFQLPLEAVQEAVAYCESEPAEIKYDWEMEEASIREREKNDPTFLTPARVAEMQRNKDANKAAS